MLDANHNADDNADNGDHDVDDEILLQAISLKSLLQATVSMKTRTTRRSNCTLVPVPLGRSLSLFHTIW